MQEFIPASNLFILVLCAQHSDWLIASAQLYISWTSEWIQKHYLVYKASTHFSLQDCLNPRLFSQVRVGEPAQTKWLRRLMCHTHDYSPVLGTVLHAYGFQNPPKLECIQTRRWFWMLPPLLPLAQLCNFPHFVKPKGRRSRGWLTLGDGSGPAVGLGNPGTITKTTSENKGLAARSEFDSKECGSGVSMDRSESP